MKIFAIADIHLSGNPATKPMSVFGEHWLNHWEKIKSDWQKKVTQNDIVLIAGDTSWAMKFPEALEDLNEIAQLPGKKILIKGNHDYWWQSVAKMAKATGGALTFLQNNFFQQNYLAICGSRGWICPDEPSFSQSDLAIYQRELLRTEASLKAARDAYCSKIILMLHFPPFSSQSTSSGFTNLIKQYGVETCVYGHLHKESAQTPSLASATIVDGVNYHLTSCDFLDFNLKEIEEIIGEIKEL